MSSWSFAVSAGLLALGAVVLTAAAWLSWNIWQRNGRRRAVAWLEALRLVLVGLLVFSLFRPEFIEQLERRERPEVAILFDASGSMDTRDIVRSNTVASRAEWLAGQRAREFWRPLQTTARVSVGEFARPGAETPPAAIGTDLHQTLDEVLKRNNSLQALLVLTDGDWNLGPSPIGVATRYREQGIPIFAVSVGREQPVEDIILENASAPSFSLFGEQVSIPFKARNNLRREVRTQALLLRGDREEARREIVLPAQTEISDTLLWSPRQVGDAVLTLQIPVESDEALTENNRLEVRVSVRVETLKVLVVDSLPRWEYRFLRNALARDPGVEMDSILFHPEIGPGGGRNYLPAFPSTKEAISRYDVIFLGDVGLGEGELAAEQAELIKGLVEQQGSGLVFLPGRRGRQATLTNSPLQELIPVQLDASRPQGITLQNESALLPTTAGRGHWMTRFDADESRNEELWKQLPGFFWSAAVEKSRPGSEVIAVHSAQRNAWGRLPLLVSRPAGNGKVLFMGTDSAWRWRRGVEDRYHYRFWSQVVRWMAHQRHLAQREGIRLAYTPETPQAGDTVFLQATVLDASGYPVEQGPVTGRVTNPSGREEQLSFTPAEGGWGVFTAAFTTQEGGDYKIEVESKRHERRLETTLPVSQPVVEKMGRPVNSEILREITRLTGGTVGGIESLDNLIAQISVLPEPRPLERRTRLWSDPRWGGLILSLLVIYWVGRKLTGLV